MRDATNTNAGNDMEEPQWRVADEALLGLLRNREQPTDGDEPLVLRLLRFTGADLRGANFSQAEITGSIFDSADLTCARFNEAQIEACSFVAANLADAVFTGAELSLVSFNHADLEGADFGEAILVEVDVKESDLSRTVFDSGATGLNFLDALSVQGMDITRIDESDMDRLQRVQLLNLGAKVHSGFRCPVCVQWFPSDWDNTGHQPGCQTCQGVGFVDWDPAEVAASRRISCMCCEGTGWISSMTATGGCLVCDGLGRLEEWGIDLSRVMTLAEEIGAGSRPDPRRYRRLEVNDVDFTGQFFAHGHVENAEFSDCTFAGCDFSNCLLVNISFTRCDFREVNFSEASLRDVIFNECQLAEAIWTNTNVETSQASRCDFAGAFQSDAVSSELLGPSDCTAQQS